MLYPIISFVAHFNFVSKSLEHLPMHLHKTIQEVENIIFNAKRFADINLETTLEVHMCFTLDTLPYFIQKESKSLKLNL